MNKENILNTLTELGLKKSEARIYFFLAKKGPKNAREISTALHLTRQQVYPVLRKLQNKAIATATLNRPTNFSVVPFEKLLEIIANAKMEEAKIIQKNKKKLLSDWKLITPLQDEESFEKFTVIKGRKYVYSKIKEMIKETKEKISLISDIGALVHEDYFGVFDEINTNPMMSKIQFRVITEVSSQHIESLKTLLIDFPSQIQVKVRNTKTLISSFPKMLLKDNTELMYFISPNQEIINHQNDQICLHTNCRSLINPFSNIFEDLWKTAKDVRQMIYEKEHPHKTHLKSVKDEESSSDLVKQPIGSFHEILEKITYIRLIHEKQSEKLKEQQIITKIINAEKSSNLEGYHSFASSGLAIVNLNEAGMPDILLRVWHFDKKSLFGAGDVFMIHLWLEKQSNHGFIPVAIVHDQPELTNNWKKWMAGTPAAKNVQTVKPNQIQVQTYGKILFAYWKNNIPLVPKEFVLPPSTLILEGYGKVISGAFSQIFPSGIHSRIEFNGFEANVILVQDKAKNAQAKPEGFIFREALLGNPKNHSVQ